MKIFLVGLVLLFLAGCGSTDNMVSREEYLGTVNGLMMGHVTYHQVSTDQGINVRFVTGECLADKITIGTRLTYRYAIKDGAILYQEFLVDYLPIPVSAVEIIQ